MPKTVWGTFSKQPEEAKHFNRRSGEHVLLSRRHKPMELAQLGLESYVWTIPFVNTHQ